MGPPPATWAIDGGNTRMATSGGTRYHPDDEGVSRAPAMPGKKPLPSSAGHRTVVPPIFRAGAAIDTVDLELPRPLD
jgi:hypothetical protein